MIGLVLVLLSAAAVTYGGGLSDERHDGNWWQTTSYQFRTRLRTRIHGGQAADGAGHGQHRRAGGHRLRCGAISRGASRGDVSLQEGVLNTQLVDGLNEFYRDYRNQRVLLPDAIEAVQLQIRRASSTVAAERYVQWLRQNAPR